MVGVPGRHPADAEIIRLAVPALGALLAEPLFLLADSAIVGHLGTIPLAGLGVAGAALTTLVNVSVFLAYGTTAAVARRLGAGDRAGALRSGIDGLWLAVLLGLVVGGTTLLAAHRFLTAFGASGPVLAAGTTYLRISALGIPAMLVVLASTGVLRGLQDTRTPLVVAVTASVGNVLVELVLVFGLHLGIAGSAWGTVLAQLGAGIAYGILVARGARAFGTPLRPSPRGVVASGKAGIPLLVRTVALRGVLLVATAVATRLGAVPLAAYQVSFTIWSTLTIALDAVAIAGQALVGRSLGAGDVTGVRAATRRMLEWGTAAGLLFTIAVLAARPLLVVAFTEVPAVRRELAAALVVVALLQPLGGPVFVLDGVLIGAGDARYLAAAGVGTLATFLPAAALVRVAGGGLVALWCAFGVFMATRLVLLGARTRGSAWLVPGAVRA